MTVDDLRAELRHMKVPEFAYSIGRDENETYCLVVETDGWHVYYSERGNRNSEEVLPSESAACERFLQRVLRDGAVQRWMAEHGS